MITVEEAEKIAGVPAREWGGKCHQISSALAPVVGGKVHRGYAPGIKPHPTSFWKGGLGQHSWIGMPDGTVVDPTRFSTEPAGTEPYIWVGPPDDYDAGGSRVRADRVGPPPDTWDTEKEWIRLALGSVDYVGDLLGTPSNFRYEDPWEIDVSFEQIMWLANLPVLPKEDPRALAAWFAAEVYEAIDDAGYKALIPIDRWNYVMNGGE
jgi:hypothetical protein